MRRGFASRGWQWYIYGRVQVGATIISCLDSVYAMSVWYMVCWLGRSLVGLLVSGVGIPPWCLLSAFIPSFHHLSDCSGCHQFLGCIWIISVIVVTVLPGWDCVYMFASVCVGSHLQLIRGFQVFNMTVGCLQLWLKLRMFFLFLFFFSFRFFGTGFCFLGSKVVTRLSSLFRIGSWQKEFGEQANIKRVIGV